MGLIKPPTIKNASGDQAAAEATSVRQAINILSRKLGLDSSPSFTSLTLSGFADNSVLFIDDTGKVSENNSNLNWDDDTDTLTVVDTLTIKDSDGDIVFYVDDDEMYFTKITSIPIATGHGMPWLFWFTYTV